MRKRKTACICAAALLLAGCAKSPENDIVIQKNTEALVSKAEQEEENRKPLAENKEQAPERYTWSYDNKDGTCMWKPTRTSRCRRPKRFPCTA